MEINVFVKKIVNALLSGMPLAVFDKTTEELKTWIILTKVEIFDSGVVCLVDEVDGRYYLNEWDVYTMDEYNDMIRQ